MAMTPAENRRLMKKARRRIKRFIETGNPQARVKQVDDTFAYSVKHKKNVLTFKLDKANRLRLVHVPAKS